MSMDLEISSEVLDSELDRFGFEQRKFAKAVGLKESDVSLYRSGGRKPTKRKARKIQEALAVANEITAKSDVPPNFNDVRWFREQIRKARGGRPPKSIKQESGSAYLREFCLHVHMSPEEFCYRVTLSPRVARADIVSLPCQRWIRAWSVAFAYELNDKLFDEFSAAFPSRDAALAALQRGAYKRLIAEVGTNKVREYLHAMILTGELESAPHDVDEN